MELRRWTQKPKLIKCPVMSHILEITFDDLVNFNTKFAVLNKVHSMFDEFNIDQGEIISDNSTQENTDIIKYDLMLS